MQRHDRARVLEGIAAVVDPGDAEAARTRDLQHLADAEVHPVAHERLVLPRGATLHDHEAAPDELPRIEPEDEERIRAVAREQLQPCDRANAGGLRDLRGEALGEERAAEVRHVALEQPEVRVSDVDQLVGRSLHAGRDRQQRDDQPDAERDARRGQHRSRRPPEQVPQHERDHGHVGIIARSPSVNGSTLAA